MRMNVQEIRDKLGDADDIELDTEDGTSEDLEVGDKLGEADGLDVGAEEGSSEGSEG